MKQDSEIEDLKPMKGSLDTGAEGKKYNLF
jgi:hypothetical protein